MYAAFTGGLVPHVLRARGRSGRGPVRWERDALSILASALAPRRLREEPLPRPPVYRRVPIYLRRAAASDELAKLDYAHLYARLAADILEEHGRSVEARWFREWIRRYEEARRSRWGSRFILFSQPSDFASYWVEATEPRRSRRCRHFYTENADEPPLTEDELIELLATVDCRVYAVRVKDVVKYVPHVTVGLTRRWGTGLWEAVIDRSVDAHDELVRAVGADAVLAYVVDAALVDATEASTLQPRTRYPVKIDARGPGVVATPGTYRVGDAYGYWGVHDEPPVEKTLWLNKRGRLVHGPTRYRGAEEVLSCARSPGPASAPLMRLLGRLGVHVAGTLCELRDACAGVVRPIDNAFMRLEGVGTAEP